VSYTHRLRKEIIINAQSEDEIRIAITEDRALVELFIETPETERHVGDIYLGRVAKVIPGMNAAFIDVGLEQDAFLHFSDVGDSYESSSAFLAGEEAEILDEDEEEEEYLVEEGATAAEQKVYRPRGGRGGRATRSNDRGLSQRTAPPSKGTAPGRIAGDADRSPKGAGLDLRLAGQHDDKAAAGSDRGRPSGRTQRPVPSLLQANLNLEPNQQILVQVTREAFANKGVRVTSRISLPGRFLVLVPFEPGIGISRKVYSVRERTRLRRIVRSLKPRELGVIIRTVAENKEESALREDLEKLLQQWRDLEKKVREIKPPTLVFQDSSLTSSVMRDLFTPDITRIVIDSRKMYREVMDYVEWAAPNLTGTVELYRGTKPIFDAFDIETQIEQTLTRKIMLRSGGYLFIEHTEAMVVIDVNSGRYAARREQELNSLKTNLEAAREVARQLRLRDIGGIIVIDFIDMSDERNRKKVYDEMKKELRKDRAKSSILPLTEFGLMQITRQRIRQSIVQSLSDTCPVCGGTGLLVSKTTIIKQVERWLERFRASSSERKLLMRVHPTLAEMLTSGLLSPLRNLQLKYFLRLKIELDESLTGDEFRFYSSKQKRDITSEYSSTGVEHTEEDEHDHSDEEPLETPEDLHATFEGHEADYDALVEEDSGSSYDSHPDDDATEWTSSPSLQHRLKKRSQ
jgi:ribonuclease G